MLEWIGGEAQRRSQLIAGDVMRPPNAAVQCAFVRSPHVEEDVAFRGDEALGAEAEEGGEAVAREEGGGGLGGELFEGEVGEEGGDARGDDGNAFEPR